MRWQHSWLSGLSELCMCTCVSRSVQRSLIVSTLSKNARHSATLRLPNGPAGDHRHRDELWAAVGRLKAPPRTKRPLGADV
eukprot:SAG11_NODE_6240_length_1355_cov_1.588376_3_plen_80_part_01